MRIDSCLQPGGLIASARMYTLAVKENTVYLLYTGRAPAFQSDYSRALKGMRLRNGVLDNITVSKVLQGYVQRITAVEEQIDSDNPEMYHHDKNKQFFLNDISAFAIRERQVEIRMSFKVHGKKITLDCPIEAKENILRLQSNIAESCCRA